MADQTPLKFVDTHNIAGYLYDPPAAHKEFQSMIVGLNTCRISHSLRENPVICKNMIAEFWNNASINPRGQDGVICIESSVQKRQIIITEEIVRDVLLFGDKSDYPTEYPTAEVSDVLVRMGYEGLYPPAIKKLFHPYWKFLIHTFFISVSGRKGGSDEISHTQMSAIVALIMDWNYNFSKFVFNEMLSNLKGRKKEMFLMYPRFLQMIFDSHYTDLVKSVETLDMKSLGPNTFGLMKQSRKGTKFVYQGLHALTKFGRFAESDNIPAIAQVAEEHAHPVQRHTAPSFELTSDDELDSSLPSAAGTESQVMPVSPVPTSDDFEKVKAKLQSTALKPPQSVTVTHEEDLEEEMDIDLVPRKRRKRDPRPGVLISEATTTIQPPTQISAALPPPAAPALPPPAAASPPPAQVSSPPAQSSPQLDQGMSFDDYFPDFDFDIHVESTSRPSGSSDVAGSAFQEKGKGIMLEQPPVDLHALQQRVFELEQDSVVKDIRIKELEDSHADKDSKIKELQANMGGLTALFYDLQQKLVSKFGDKFDSAADVQKGQDESHPDSNVDTSEALQKYLSESSMSKEKSDQLQKKIMIMKNLDQNVTSSDHPDKFVIELQQSFSTKYGDRSGILAWGFDADKSMWWVKRKTGNIEYYNKMKRFGSWTKVDLSDLINAPFVNPSNDKRGVDFWNFLRRQVDHGFPTMPTAESFLKKAKGVIDPKTGKTVVNVMWPATEKVTRIPLPDAIPDGTLENMKFWTYDSATATVVIRLQTAKGQLRLIDHRDLLKLGERDIKTLSTFQIIADPGDEVAAKQYTSMVASIIRTGYWAGGIKGADVEIMEHN